MDNKQDGLKYEDFIKDVQKGVYSDVVERCDIARISMISEAVDLQQRIEEDNVILYGLS